MTEAAKIVGMICVTIVAIVYIVTVFGGLNRSTPIEDDDDYYRSFKED